MVYCSLRIQEKTLNEIVELCVTLEPYFEMVVEEVDYKLKFIFTEPEIKPCKWINLLSFCECVETEILITLDKLASFTHNVVVVNETSGISRPWFELQLTEFIDHCRSGDQFNPMRFEFTLNDFGIQAFANGRRIQSPCRFI